MDDLNEIANVEAECFPAAEAATKEEFAGRIRYYGNHFWIMLEEDKLIAFVDGFVTDEADLTDEMYEKAAMHNEDGAWQMIFGVNTLPDYRKHGYAGQLIIACEITAFCPMTRTLSIAGSSGSFRSSFFNSVIDSLATFKTSERCFAVL